MADRYQERPFAAQQDDDRDYDRGANPNASSRAESDPLAELARLIGQTDPFGSAGKPPHPLQSRVNAQAQYQPPAEEDDGPAAGPPPWMQRANRPVAPQQEPEEPEYQPSPVHPLHRYAAQQPTAPAQEYQEEAPQYADAEPQPDPERYDDALYGQIESGEQDFQRDPAYPHDPYAYESSYEEEPEPRKRSGGLVTVAAILALAVVGTGAALAYRTYIGSPRTGEPPIIKADNSPTKVVPAPADAGAKTPDRMVPGDGGEKIVSREETPVDVNAKSGPRVVFPPLNQNGNPPPVASVTPSAPPPATAANGTMPNSEPRKVKIISVKGDPAENGGVPVGAAPPAAAAKSAPAARTAGRNPSSANPSANTPLSLSPQEAQSDAAPGRVATTTPVQAAPAAGAGYMVQVSSQKNEADAQASYRALQGKFPAVLGSRSPVIRRADLAEKGVVYRSMVGPFGSQEEASQFCGNLKAAGGQCVILRN
jgi:SPOR domain